MSSLHFILHISTPKRVIFVKLHTGDTMAIPYTYSSHGKQRTSLPIFRLPQVTFSGIFLSEK